MALIWPIEITRWLGLPQGDFYQRLYGFLPWWAAGTAAFVIVAALLHACFRPRLATMAAGRMSNWRDGVGLALWCVLLTAALDGAGFTQGFFRQDDFSFLQVTRETPRLGAQILLRHNDHVCPLYRFQVWALVHLAGPATTATNLAAWFNGLSLLTSVALLLATGWLMHELGGSRVAVFMLVTVLWAWPGWGEFTAGYYTLSVYLQVQALAAAACAAALRAGRRQAPAWLSLSLLFVGLALALNTSGVLALGAAFLAGVALLLRDRRRLAHRYLLALLLLFAGFCLFYLAASSGLPVPRELVQNPASGMLDSSIAANLHQHGPAAVAAAAASLGGTALNLLLPTFLQLGAEAAAASVPLRWSIFAVEIAVTVMLLAFARRSLRQLGSDDRILTLTLAATAGVGSAMVLVARTHYAATIPVSLWHAKYLLMPTCWLCVAGVFAFDRHTAALPQPNPFTSRAAWVVAGASLWLTLSVWQGEKVLLPTNLAYTARGRWGNVENARARRNEHARLMQDLASLRDPGSNGEIRLPDPDRWQAEFFRQYPTLEWATDHTPRGVTHLFGDMTAAAPQLGLWVRWQPLETMTGPQRLRLQSIPWLRPAFATSPDLPPPISTLPAVTS